MTLGSVMNEGKEVSVKVEFYGELRRFATQGGSFGALKEEVASVLSVDRGRELAIKYRDEEGDLITMSTDLELKSAISSGGLLRLLVTYKEQQNPLLDVNTDTTALQPQVQATAPPVLYPQVGPQPGDQGVMPPVDNAFGGGHFPFGPHGGPFGPHGGPFGHHGGPFGPHGGPWGHHRGGPWGHHGRRGHEWDGHHGGWGGRGGRAYCKKFAKYAASEEAPAWFQNHDALVEQVAQLGFDVKKEKISKMLMRADGNVDEVASRLAWKKEKKEWKTSKKEMKKK